MLKLNDWRGSPTVVTLKWGDRYEAGYVNVLYRAVASHLTNRPFRFICFTDNPAGIIDNVETRAIPPLPIDLSSRPKGMWPKLLIFKPNIFSTAAPVLYLDLDVMITSSLERLFGRIETYGGLHIVREWNPTIWRALPVGMRPHRGANSSVVGFRAGEQCHLWQAFVEDPEAIIARYHNDQKFIDAHAVDKHYWPNSWCGSFKRHCAWHWPLNHVFRTPMRPRQFSILTFHGRPDYPDLLCENGQPNWGTRWRPGNRPVPWVKDYCDTYGRPTVQKVLSTPLL